MREEQDEIDRLEAILPAAADAIFAAARETALASGQSVLQSEDGAIYEVFPDGRRRFVKNVKPPVSVVAESILIIR